MILINHLFYLLDTRRKLTFKDQCLLIKRRGRQISKFPSYHIPSYLSLNF